VPDESRNIFCDFERARLNLEPASKLIVVGERDETDNDSR
jgi:hypothetical protein